jgi:ribosomal protein S18 acetylase RimI-like enzyme
MHHQRRIAKDKDARRLALEDGRMADRACPELRALTAASFASAPPVWTCATTVTEKGSGLVQLLWEPSASAPAGRLNVDTLTFTLQSTDGVVMALEDTLGVGGVELNNVVVMEAFRGWRGGNVLCATMLRELRAHGVSFVVLRALDRGGGGKLYGWYERMGFHDARAVLPEAVADAVPFEPFEHYMFGVLDELLALAEPP